MITSKDNALYVRDPGRRYRMATPDQVIEAARAIAGDRTKRGTAFGNPTVARDFFLDKMAALEREVFAVAFLDTRHRLIAYEELFFGSIDGAEVHPRVVVRQAMLHNAAATIAVHNHPSGVVEPSAADRALTARLKQALALVEVRLLDHIVVGGHQTLSMAERGWL